MIKKVYNKLKLKCKTSILIKLYLFIFCELLMNIDNRK